MFVFVFTQYGKCIISLNNVKTCCAESITTVLHVLFRCIQKHAAFQLDYVAFSEHGEESQVIRSSQSFTEAAIKFYRLTLL